MTAITQDAVRELSDSQLGQVGEWIRIEQKARAERHKQQTLAKIRELAKSIEVGVKIEGVRGWPKKSPTI
jgi:hypothetical protein